MSNDPDGETTQTMTESAGGRPGPARSDGELAAIAERDEAQARLCTVQEQVAGLRNLVRVNVEERDRLRIVLSVALEKGEEITTRLRADRAALVAAVTNLLALADARVAPGAYPPAGLHDAIEEARALLARMGGT